MYKARLLQVRRLIDDAKQQESSKNTLGNILRLAVPKLHDAIKLPTDEPEQALTQFIIQYIDHVPDFIEALADISVKAKIEDFTGTLLNLCLDFFLSPPDIVEEHSGLIALLDEAYLSHRVLEEVNDKMILTTGVPLIPMDMTNANLLVHGLIGEAFANQLDFAVYYSLEIISQRRQNIDDSNLKKYAEEHQLNGWENDMKRWPCLAENLDIAFSFTNS